MNYSNNICFWIFFKNSFVERSCTNINVEHHFPLWWAHRLMKTKPYLTTATKRRCLSNGSWEKGTADWCIFHWWQMAHNYIKCLNSLEWDSMKTTIQRKFQRIERYSGNPLKQFMWTVRTVLNISYFYGNTKCSITSFTRKSYFKFNPLTINWKWLGCVHVSTSIKYRPSVLENLVSIWQMIAKEYLEYGVSKIFDHGFNNFSINPSGTLVRLYIYIIVV